MTPGKADILGVTLNMIDLNRRRHHRDPGATYKAYRKYYQMETKKSVFGFNLGNAGKPKSGVKRSVAVQTPPDRDSVYREPADSFED